MAKREEPRIFLAFRAVSLAMCDVLPPGPVDDTDRRLLALLRDDARRSAATLARTLGVSRATVQNRIARLQREGAILGFTLRLSPEADPRRVRAVMMVAVEGKSSAPIVRALRGFPEVVAIHTTNGRWDLVVELRTEGLEAFDHALGRIRLIEGIAATETSLLLSSHVL